MKVAFLQFEPSWGDPQHNLAKITAALTTQTFDLIVLPELCSTGYLFSSRDALRAQAEPIPDGPTTQALVEIARQKDAFVIAGLAEREGVRLYNTAMVVGPQGFVGKHRKRHFSPLEAKLFDRGAGLRVFDLNGVSVGVVICFESWFPEACRALVLQGAKLLCSPANFGGPQSLTIGRARAIENNVFFVTANRTGAETLDGFEAHFRGESQIIGPTGDLLARAQGREGVGVVDIDPSLAGTGKLMGADFHDELQLYSSPVLRMPLPGVV
ncbi:MAG TPA: nitrilase-related carbon-nitrogen hydrolase [Candidatus Binatia bacterium]|nr:nitrilase-related carbon-nitrogen hydrolase [Candidatus Binatia bacterium]